MLQDVERFNITFNWFKKNYFRYKMITSGQIRAARALLKWNSTQLSSFSGIGTTTIRRYELSDGVPNANISTLSKIKQTLEAAGVEFIGAPDNNPGVRLLTDKVNSNP